MTSKKQKKQRGLDLTVIEGCLFLTWIGCVSVVGFVVLGVRKVLR